MSDGLTAYLREHPPASPQFRSPRRNRLTGAIVVHTAESVLDSIGPDTGAENVAGFIGRRGDPGSYHDLCDSDSIVHLVDYDDEAFHVAVYSGNRFSIGLSFACRTTDWAKMTAAQRGGFIDNGADAAARMAAHVKTRTGIVVPARRITVEQFRAGAAGFISHGELDPGRRSDPGNAPGQFPWETFLFEVAVRTQPQEFIMDAEARAAFAALTKEVADLKTALASKAEKGRALRGPDGRVWIVGQLGRWHVRDQIALNGMIWNGQVLPYGSEGVQQVGDDILAGIPIVPSGA